MWNKITFLIAALSLSSFGEVETKIYLKNYVLNIAVLSPKRNHENIKLNIYTYCFNPLKHKVEQNESEYGFSVDGNTGYGYDGPSSFNSHASETIQKFEILWRNKKILIKPELLNTIFNYDLSEKGKNSQKVESGIGAIISEDNNKLMVSMTSYRCATAGYTVHWIVSENGEQSRFIDVSSR